MSSVDTPPSPWSRSSSPVPPPAAGDGPSTDGPSTDGPSTDGPGLDQTGTDGPSADRPDPDPTGTSRPAPWGDPAWADADRGTGDSPGVAGTSDHDCG